MAVGARPKHNWPSHYRLGQRPRVVVGVEIESDDRLESGHADALVTERDSVNVRVGLALRPTGHKEARTEWAAAHTGKA